MIAMSETREITYDPGIFGFVKGHRHHSGAALVMSSWEEEDQDMIAIFWVKRLHWNASPVRSDAFWTWTPQSMKAAERTYDLFLSMGPPLDALVDYQKERVYRWEADNIYPGYDSMTWEQCERFLKKCWKQVSSAPVPKLVPRRRLQPCAYLNEIHLPDDDGGTWIKPVLLHEMAHILEAGHQHDPKFVARYIKLCVKFLGMEKKHLRESAGRYGVQHRAT
jgi:hypothetical protein